MEPLYWLILLAIFLVIEIITLGLTTIWLAGGALVGFLAAVLHVPLPIQIVLFLVVSIVLIVFTRPVASVILITAESKPMSVELSAEREK